MINQVLTVAQCEDLVALGVDMSDASMCWLSEEYINPMYNHYTLHISSHLNRIENKIPTYTLQDILNKLPKVIEKNGVKYHKTTKEVSNTISFAYYNKSHNLNINVEFAETYLEAAFNMLKWCKQNNYI